MRLRPLACVVALYCTIAMGQATASGQMAAGQVAPAQAAPVLDVMKRAADWQLAHPSRHAPYDWTQAAFYIGVMALVDVSGDAKYLDAMRATGEANQWRPGPRPGHADDYAVITTYAKLAQIDGSRARLGPSLALFNFLADRPYDEPLAWGNRIESRELAWCDALFMGPPAMAAVTAVTGDRRYLDLGDRLWWKTTDFLYDKDEHLYFRDSRYFDRREPNGKKVFWSRGNGWVLAGIALMLREMPADYPSRPRYVTLFSEMAERIRTLQGEDGYWRASLLDPDSVPSPESSGTGFFTYALAWGINNGLLDRAVFEPHARRGWAAMERAVQPDGMLGWVQAIGAEPGTSRQDTTEIYGVGALLLAGSEVHRLDAGPALAAPSASGQDGWRALFDGRTLDGWYTCNGTAPFTVEDGAIVGRTVTGSPNTFLCAKETFGDFILEYEVKVESDMNSGVMIRGIVDPAIKKGRMHGYQVEIDPSDRAWSGGIYDEARRGWLHTLEGQDAAQQALRKGAWNRFRVEAIGPSIRTWVNGVEAANIVDDQTPRGLVALQVHSIGSETARAGEAISFRNIRILTAGLERHRTPDTGTAPQFNHTPNSLTEREKQDGWKLLWDGKTTAGWRGAKLDRFPPSGWRIENGVLSVMAAEGRESAAAGDIVTVDQYRNFELIVEFQITEGANSGIKYFVDTDLNKGEGSAIGCEFQILDDATHPDAKMGRDGNRKLAGLYDLIPPKNVRFNGIGEWNRARIVVRGARVEHWMNGFKTVAYERGTDAWRRLVAGSKFHVWPNFGEAAKGHILLQDHGNLVSFRSIKIRELD